VIREEAERLVVACDNKCPVRLDLGPVNAALARNRTPSGWISAGGDRHYCPLCSPSMTMAFFAAQSNGVRSQPLT
jgi:hypothetical protein